jgi:hypothetical protein
MFTVFISAGLTPLFPVPQALTQLPFNEHGLDGKAIPPYGERQIG